MNLELDGNGSDVEIINGAIDYDGSEEIVGSFGDWLVGAAKTVAKGVKAIVKSKITKVVAGATAIAFPAVGIPLASSLVVADRVIDVTEGLGKAKGKPELQKKMRAAVKHTIHLAKQGDPDARRTVRILATAKTLRRAIGTAEEGTLVSRRGLVTHGRFRRV